MMDSQEKVREVEYYDIQWLISYLEKKIDNCYRGDAYQLGKISAYEDILKKLKDIEKRYN